MKTRTLVGLGAVVIALGIGVLAFNARSQDRGFGPPFMRHGPGGSIGHGMGGDQDIDQHLMGMTRDPATVEQLRAIHALFINHDRIKRTVTNLPDGIRTVTESDDPQTAVLLKTHVADMMKRVGNGDDPGLPIESDALRAIFRDKDKIRTSAEITANGVVVVQTSNDPKVISELQEHAAQVSDFAKEGMAALHSAMIRNFGGRMHGGMMGHGMMRGPM
jgi:hypothetical protein